MTVKLAGSEAELANIVIGIAEDHGWRVFRLPAGNYAASSGSGHNRNGVRGASKGYPDLTLARNHQVLWIELKVAGNGMSEAQMEWLRELPVVVLVTDRWSREEVGRLLA